MELDRTKKWLFALSACVGLCVALLLVVASMAPAPSGPHEPIVFQRAPESAAPAPPPDRVERVPMSNVASAETVVVLVTLPGADGVPGPSPVQHPTDLWLDDEHVRLGIGTHIYPKPEPNNYKLAVIFREMLVRPSDQRLVAMSPKIGLILLSWQADWRRSRVQWADGLAIDSERLFADEVRMARAIIDSAPRSEAARFAGLTLIQAGVAASPEANREQVLWDGIIDYLSAEQFDHDSHPEVGMLLFGMRSINAPEIRPGDHATLARYFDQTKGRAPGFHGRQHLDDMLIRDALRNDDIDWARYWWANVERERRWRYGEENAAQLAGVILAKGEAHTWEDGLRSAAVHCSEEQPGRPLEADIFVQGSTWHISESNGAAREFLDCTLGNASPMAPEGQRAHLVVVQTPPS